MLAMSKRIEKSETTSGLSFFTVAAWSSLLIPFATVVITYFVASASDRIGHILRVAACVLLGSLVLGLASLFCIPSDAGKPIVWVAWVGIVASLVFGYLALALGGVFSGAIH
jgi:hypothetical protein